MLLLDSIAEIMDSEDPLFIYILLALRENQREWFTPRQDIWYKLPIHLKMFFNYEENDVFWCTADIG
jgi:acetyl-CoA synthetase